MPPGDPWQHQHRQPQSVPPGWGPQGPVYQQPRHPVTYGNLPPKKGKGALVILISVVVLVVLGVGGYLGFRALSPGSTGGGASSGELFEASSGLYSVRVPDTVRKGTPGRDTTVPSKIDFRFNPLTDKGGVIKIGTTAGDMAREPVEEVGAFVAKNFEDSPQGWEVDKKSVTIDGHAAMLVSMQSKVTAAETKPGNRSYTRFYFISTSSGGEVVFMACDWNDTSTELGSACDHIVNSMKIKTGSVPPS